MKNMFDWIWFPILGIVIYVLALMVYGCGIDMSNTQNQASGDASVSSYDNQGVAITEDCNVEWGYITVAKSALTIITITGASTGTWVGTCSDDSIINGSFSEGSDIDPCPSDNANNSTFSLSCGWSETITFNS